MRHFALSQQQLNAIETSLPAQLTRTQLNMQKKGTTFRKQDNRCWKLTWWLFFSSFLFYAVHAVQTARYVYSNRCRAPAKKKNRLRTATDRAATANTTSQRRRLLRASAGDVTIHDERSSTHSVTSFKLNGENMLRPTCPVSDSCK